jgi:hypothetical protein
MKNSNMYYAILGGVALLGFSALYATLHLVDLVAMLVYILFIFESLLNIIIIILQYLFGIFKASIPYIFLYFCLCLFNLYYEGYYKFKFFGILLDTYQNKIKFNK